MAYGELSKFSDLKPNEIIKLVELGKAAELILLKKFTVSQIANMVGFSEQSNFSRDFHKHFGLRPSNFTNRMGNNFVS
ncbi:helix-turn-helix domain-containing protein [Sphingobacterium sp.]|uniref:helix-turn-helix domain-containing protein n=1 Tax=Sphingobacterium sp. TaxID=341027 RepID=UPI0028B13F95|nr:helix-turn-helix domain-containing protein [Sphingobacterium sp.]